MTDVKQLKVKKKRDISMKKLPINTDNYQLNYFIAGSLSARYPQIKNSIYESAEMETIEFKTF